MSNEFELPVEGIKIYSPEAGWRSGDTAAEAAAQASQTGAAPLAAEAPVAPPPRPQEPSLASGSFGAALEAAASAVAEPIDIPLTYGAETQAAALAEVGDSLHGLFLALQSPASTGQMVDSGPSWRDVADLSRVLEDRLMARQSLIDQLSEVEGEIRQSREDLLGALRNLAHQEQRNLESATVRANISSLAANVIAKKFSG
ncbi:MAG: hypothetical protein EBT03_05970 [Betaproteobacteria bacterium]|mgnify:CR=1 FL=1|nr:hypothetical protein [Betaproteobacteria bacterium]NBT75985.1 hypothetical protein [Betaproteobacteria bacterium]NBY14416.1 hypothetical protein [Betaproteobacteria bacterium]NCA17293.1 hypothetical protein [Betaproteobacteria bacterium]NDF04266.1 hypothetical protein [Betaproteobacteria bacterium]